MPFSARDLPVAVRLAINDILSQFGTSFSPCRISTFYLQIEGKAEREGFEPSRRLNTAYAISNLKRASYQFRARRPNLSYCVRSEWSLAAIVEVLIYPGVHRVRSRTDPVAVRLQ